MSQPLINMDETTQHLDVDARLMNIEKKLTKHSGLLSYEAELRAMLNHEMEDVQIFKQACATESLSSSS